MTDGTLIDWKEIGRWSLCGAAVLAAHMSVAAAVMNWPEPAPAEPAAALVIELAALPASPPAPETDLAPGPEQEQVETEDTPDIAEVPPEPEEPEPTPEVEPEEPPPPEVTPAPKPEVAIAPPPKPVKKRKPRPKKQIAAAPKPVAALPAERAVAPSQGEPTRSNAAAVSTWKGRLFAHLNRHKRPTGGSGIVRVAFTIDGTGYVTSARLAVGSGNPALDSEAVALVRRASPVPPPPPDAGRSVVVPIRFN